MFFFLLFKQVPSVSLNNFGRLVCHVFKMESATLTNDVTVLSPVSNLKSADVTLVMHD